MLPFFTIFFICGVVGVAIIIVKKIPLVLATPKDVINDYFSQETARVHIRLLRMKEWFKEGAYWDPALALLLRILRIARLGILKLERNLFNQIQTVNRHYEKRKSEKNGISAEREEILANPEYWQGLKSTMDKNSEEGESN